MLTPDEVAHYHETGQVTPIFRLGGDVIGEIQQKADALFASRPDLDPDYAHSLIEADISWLEFARHPGILDCVGGLMGDDIIVWGSALFCKRGKGGKPTPWHQDGQYWPMRPLRACTVWIALDPSTTENGCLRVIPGSHKSGKIIDHDVDQDEKGVLGQEVSLAAMPDASPVDVVLEPGMISIHDVFTVHGAEPNNSGARRGGLTFRYMPSSSYYDRDLAVELGRQAGGVALDHRQLHLVRGIDQSGRNDIYQAPA